ncbi:hypothetical protein RA28_20850 [Ruegeria sp. ANG-S4]|uniref:efflux RND transporter periplasmic adaptor subunit n=1 Tax=Ruegeria sp. ANG-S4 TaxID=1577904 RepID=UPI00057ECC6C|nr:efflux RND transporter periplasmic adaptor subunit [Ruegeria sp. ANG-S4]KIC41360.1 hypothetical protein RA28_20850 [Ruegeria sp. ANG-S4]
MKRIAEVFGVLIVGCVLGALTANFGLFREDNQKPASQQTSGDKEPDTSFPTNAIVVTATEVQVTPPRTLIQSIGTGKAAQLVHLTADFSGTVEAIQVRPNSEVGIGDPIVTFERRTQQILLESAKAEIEKQEASFDRLQTLLQQNSAAVSQSQVDEARAALALANAQLAEAQYEYDRRVVRAPFSGEINLNDLTIGSYIPQGSEIVTLVDASTLFVEFSVSETAIDQVQTGAQVRLTTPALVGRVFEGEIVAFDTSINEEFRTVRIRAQVRNPDNVLLPGLTFSVSLAQQQKPLPRIPSVSVLWDRNGAYVWRINPSGQPEQVEVTLRHRLGDSVWVEADLDEGDRVVEDGAFKISQGASVTLDIVSPTNGSSDG